MTSEKRLIEFGLTSLEKRRIRGDLIQFFKIWRGIESVKWSKQPAEPNPSGEFNRHLRYPGERSTNRLKAESFNAKQRNDFHAAVNIREQFLTNRVIPFWNKLPEEVINITRPTAQATVNCFKAKLDNFIKLDKNFFSHGYSSADCTAFQADF